MLAGVTTMEHIESYVPERTISVAELADRLALKPANVKVLTKLQGLRRLRFDPQMSLFELVLPAARRAVAAQPPGTTIRYVIFVHATQAVTPPNVDAAQTIKEALGLHQAEAFGLSQQNCAVAVTAVDVAGELLRADGDPAARALIVSGEKAFTPELQLVRDTTIFGEGAAACVVAVGGSGDPVLSFAQRTLGRYAGGMRMDRALAPELGELYTPMLAGAITDAIAKAGLELADIDLILPHNVNAKSWWEVAKELDIDRKRVFLDNVPRYSHCYTSDLFINYATARDSGRLVPGRHYVMAAVGVGTTFAALAFRHRGR